MLRRICGPERNEVREYWRRLHNEKLCDHCLLPYIIRVIKSRRPRWTGSVARMGERRGAYRVLDREIWGKSPRGRPRCRWEGNIKRDLPGIGWWRCGLDWSDSG